jgi:hypothetical protein
MSEATWTPKVGDEVHVKAPEWLINNKLRGKEYRAFAQAGWIGTITKCREKSNPPNWRVEAGGEWLYFIESDLEPAAAAPAARQERADTTKKIIIHLEIDLSEPLADLESALSILDAMDWQPYKGLPGSMALEQLSEIVKRAIESLRQIEQEGE